MATGTSKGLSRGTPRGEGVSPAAIFHRDARSKLLPMAASMYIVVEGEDPGFDIFVNGRALARNENALEKLALQLEVRPLIDFFSVDVNSLALLIEEGAGNPSIVNRLPPPQWYTGIDGLRTVERLLAEMERDPAILGTETELLREELQGYATVLHKVEENNARWHLAVSWR